MVAQRFEHLGCEGIKSGGGVGWSDIMLTCNNLQEHTMRSRPNAMARKTRIRHSGSQDLTSKRLRSKHEVVTAASFAWSRAADRISSGKDMAEVNTGLLRVQCDFPKSDADDLERRIDV